MEVAEFPPGVAYVEKIGWQEDEENGRRFVAMLVFPNGAPDLPAMCVWKQLPVAIQVQGE
jgi:hypothetical protein